MSILNAVSTQFDKYTIFRIADYSNCSDGWSPFIVKSTNYNWDAGWGIAENGSLEKAIGCVNDYGLPIQNVNLVRLYLGRSNVP
ncbi:MAG: hypothetical protein ACI85Q_002693 [Salibacteraceae bacterium]|jgi:hypothetical protein